MLVRKSLRRILLMLLTTVVALTACNVGAAPVPTVDVNAVNTAAFSTALAQISAQQTQTALAAPSATPSPTNTTAAPLITVGAGNGTALPTALPGTPATVSFLNPNTTQLAGFTPLASPAAPAATIPADACNNSAFEGDITIPDGSVIEPGVNFQKVWALRNTGTCLWDDGYSLVYIGGSKPDLDPYTFNFSKTKDNDFVPAGQSINIAINLTSPCTPGKYEGHWRMRDDRGYFFGTILSVYIEVKTKRKNCG